MAEPVRGTVVRVTRKGAIVRLDREAAGERRHLLCALGGRLFSGPRRRAAAVVAGDEVEVEEGGDSPLGRISRSLPRRNELRRATGPPERRELRTLAANLDRLYIVSAFAEPPYRTGFLDRSLVVAFAHGVTPVFVFNKLDLAGAAGREALARDLARYRTLGLETHRTSTLRGDGLDGFRASVARGRSVLFGHSGVGKTALLAALGVENRRTGALDRRGRGRHTTTSAELVALPGGGEIVDTPGVRALGLDGLTPEQVREAHPDLARFAADCRFAGCAHRAEPDCAVQAAVAAGAADEARYRSLLRLAEEAGRVTPRLPPAAE